MTEGVGVLSLCLTPIAQVTIEKVLDFNYRLAEFRRQYVACLRKPHPRDEPGRWSQISEADRAKIGEPPSAEEPIELQLGLLAGAFDLLALCEYLLLPLKSLI